MMQKGMFVISFREETWALHFSRGFSDPSDPDNILYPIGSILLNLNLKNFIIQARKSVLMSPLFFGKHGNQTIYQNKIRTFWD